MKIKDIIANVSKTKDFKRQVYIGDLAENVFDLSFIQNWEDQEVITSYYFGSWHCTDAEVGYKVYFFEDRPVAVSSQTGRKAEEVFEWISFDDYKKVKAYILTFLDGDLDTIVLVDLDQDLGDTYKVEYYDQMYNHHKQNAIYNSVDVKIVDFKDSVLDNKLYKFQPETVKIKFADGTTKWLETKELDFKFNII